MIHLSRTSFPCAAMQRMRKLAGSIATVTLNVQLATLPEESVAVQLTSVVPIPNTLPDAGVQITGTFPSQLSAALGVNVTTPPSGLLALVKIFPEQVMMGTWLSTTSTCSIQLAQLPHVSVAVHTTKFVPFGNTGGTGALFVRNTFPPQLSVTLNVDALKFTVPLVYVNV